MNTIIVLGNIGNDAEVKTFDNGKSIVNFSIATSKKWNNKEGESQEETIWHSIKCSNLKLAPYLKRGTKVSVRGSQINKYNKETKKSYSYIRMEDLHFANSKNTEDSALKQDLQNKNDDLPF